MMRVLLTATAALALAACGDTGGGISGSAPLEPQPPHLNSGDVWTIFTTQTPNETLTTADSAWEVATRFYTTKAGCVPYMRFWRAAGETGTNRIKLWTNSGTLIVARDVDLTGNGTGWQYAYISSIVCLQPYTNYRVSVNTNTAQVKTFGAFLNNPIVNGPLVATDGYYGQPAGSMPTTHSYSNFFVDVVFVES